jgi:uncharacterized repeat protein (TIGR03803 family)
MKKIAFLTLSCLFLLTIPVGAQFSWMHEFAGGDFDGAGPHGSLIIAGSTLYGMSRGGGDYEMGAIFKIQTDGSSFVLLHSFRGGNDDGWSPWGSLIISGSTLYGMTYCGGDNNSGTIFKIETNGDGFALLHEFSASPANGKHPYGSLVISGSTLYGMTYYGGDNDIGTIFKIETSGADFTLLHEFIGGLDGSNPFGSLILSGSTLYGMTRYGGDSGYGTVFKIQLDGTVYTQLHAFSSGTFDGAFPSGDLIISGSTLYGMTFEGGDDNFGTIFKIETDGNGFTLLHSFASSGVEGENPYANLTISGTTLYGMTPFGGKSEYGTIFSVQTNGTGFALLHEFVGGNDDGSQPNGSLLISGSTLYGMTLYGGDNDIGVIFSLPVPAWTTVDFNGDGKTDIVWQNAATGRNICWYMNGVARIDSVYLPTQDTAWTIVGCADFNADGKTDILFWNPATGQNIVWYMDGVARTGSVYLPTQDTAWTNAGTGDFNSDGKPDILWRNPATGKNICWYMDGVTRTGSVYLPTQVTAWTLAGRADFNADGKTDIMWWNAATGRNICWYMNGVARTGSVYMPTQATAWENVGSGDFNSDGKPDMLWRNKTTGKNICWYMNGVTRTGSVYLPTQVDLNWKLVN